MELYLINEVCKREVLWNEKHEHYTCPYHYQAAWKEVAELVHLDVEDAITLWQELVAHFVRARENLGDTGDWKKCPFNYYNMMLFLKDAKNLSAMFPEMRNDNKPLEFAIRNVTAA